MLKSKRKILVTGAAGYIGSHTCVELLNAGFDIVALDNLSNSSEESLRRVSTLTGQQFPFYEIDVRDTPALEQLFQAHKVDAVIHFAGYKAVGESVEHAHRYYENNVQGTLMLMRAMSAHGVTRLVFSSSATVYGDPDAVPIDESAPYRPESPYGKSKMMVEQILQDHHHSTTLTDNPWAIATLRYFNPVGAHDSGLIGEDPKGVPNNLMPYVAQVAVGKREKLHVFGGDYPTPDGTGVRDYIHVVDLAQGHVAALRPLFENPTLLQLNLGTGKGSSVLDLVKAFERASGRAVPYEITARRAGDVPSYYAKTDLASSVLGWKARLTLDDMCASTWKWQSQNPDGYGPANCGQ